MRNLILTVVLVAAGAVSPAQQTPPEAMTLPTPSPVRFFNLAHSGSLATAVRRDNRLRVWALPQRRLLRTIELGDRPFAMTAMSADGHWVLMADHNGGPVAWDI